MLNLVSVLGYGDCLITLSLLERGLTPAQPEYRLLGSAVTRRVAALMRTPPPVTEVLPDTAAFYTLRDSSRWRAVQDFVSLRVALGRATHAGDTLGFERSDLRTRALLPPGRRGVFMVSSGRVYADRRTWLEALLGPLAPWSALPRPAAPPERVVINPCARSADRRLSAATLRNLLGLGRARGWEITVLDPDGEFAWLQVEVSAYHLRPALETAVATLRGADLYIGPDSFLLHLAYYYGVPCLGFYFSHHHAFLVPGMEQTGNFLDFTAGADRVMVESALDRLWNGR